MSESSMQTNRSTLPTPAGLAAAMSWLLNAQSTPLLGPVDRQPALMVNSSTTSNGGQPAFQANPPPLASLYSGGPNQMASVGSAIPANTNQQRFIYCTPPPLAHISAPEQPTQIPGTVTALADTTTTHINEKGEVEQVVVKDGEVFYISFVDEPLPAETHIVPYEADTLPSIATELSQLLDSSKFPESAIPANELVDSSSRDWINYDELPLLSQHQQLVSTSTDRVSQHTGPSRGEPAGENCCSSKPSTPEYRKGICSCSCKSLNASVMRRDHSSMHDENDNSLSSYTADKNAERMPDFSNYCVECEVFFPTVDALQAHMELEHRLIAEVSTHHGTFSGPCNESTGCWPTVLQNHTNNQQGTGPFFCDSCALSFLTVESFYRHNRLGHVRSTDRSSSGR